MSLSQTLLELGAGVGIIVAGALAHEAAHAIVGRLLGGRVINIDPIQLHVDIIMPSAPRERLMLLAPGLIGLAAAPGLWLLWDGAVGLLQAAVAISWVIFTFTGGTDGEISLPGIATRAR